MENSQDAAIGDPNLLEQVMARLDRLESIINLQLGPDASTRFTGMQNVIEAASRVSKFKVRTIKSNLRTTDVVLWRYAAIYVMREDYDVTVVQIARFLGNRDHSSIVSALKAVNNRPQDYPGIESAILDIRIAL